MADFTLSNGVCVPWYKCAVNQVRIFTADEKVVFLLTHTASNLCTAKVFTVEMHHQCVDKACPGDNVGFDIKGLDMNNVPRSGDVMCIRRTPPWARPGSSTRRSRFSNAIKVGYSPIGFVRCGHAACRISALKWKRGIQREGWVQFSASAASRV